MEALQEQVLIRGYEPMVLPNAILLDVADGKQQAVRDALAGVAQIDHVGENQLFDAPGSGASEQPSAEAEASPPAGWSLGKTGVERAHAEGWDGTGITVGVTDSGLDLNVAAVRSAYRGSEPDGTVEHDYNWFDSFEGQPEPHDPHGHGTAVTGVLAGSHPAMPGVAADARIIAATVANAQGKNTTVAALRGLQFMLAPTKVDGTQADPRRGADVVNLSWGNSDLGDSSMRESIDALRAAGIVVVAATGNSGPDESTMKVPAAYPGVISVAATDVNDEVASFSSRGDTGDDSMPSPMLAAPGRGITVVLPGGVEKSVNGTSVAAPQVAGAVAAMLEAVPDASEQQIVDALTGTATDVSLPGNDALSGAGRLDVGQAIIALRAAAGDR